MTPQRLGKETSTRSYATEENLMAALEKFGFTGHRMVICKTVEGRWTAVFPVSNIQDGNLMRYAHQGFMTIG